MSGSAMEVFRIVHAGHDLLEVTVVSGPVASPIICLTCHEEQHPEPAPPGEER